MSPTDLPHAAVTFLPNMEEPAPVDQSPKQSFQSEIDDLMKECKMACKNLKALFKLDPESMKVVVRLERILWRPASILEEMQATWKQELRVQRNEYETKLRQARSRFQQWQDGVKARLETDQEQHQLAEAKAQQHERLVASLTAQLQAAQSDHAKAVDEVHTLKSLLKTAGLDRPTSGGAVEQSAQLPQRVDHSQKIYEAAVVSGFRGQLEREQQHSQQLAQDVHQLRNVNLRLHKDVEEALLEVDSLKRQLAKTEVASRRTIAFGSSAAPASAMQPHSSVTGNANQSSLTGGLMRSSTQGLDRGSSRLPVSRQRTLDGQQWLQRGRSNAAAMAAAAVAVRAIDSAARAASDNDGVQTFGPQAKASTAAGVEDPGRNLQNTLDSKQHQNGHADSRSTASTDDALHAFGGTPIPTAMSSTQAHPEQQPRAGTAKRVRLAEPESNTFGDPTAAAPSESEAEHYPPASQMSSQWQRPSAMTTAQQAEDPDAATLPPGLLVSSPKHPCSTADSLAGSIDDADVEPTASLGTLPASYRSTEPAQATDPHSHSAAPQQLAGAPSSRLCAPEHQQLAVHGHAPLPHRIVGNDAESTMSAPEAPEPLLPAADPQSSHPTAAGRDGTGHAAVAARGGHDPLIPVMAARVAGQGLGVGVPPGAEQQDLEMEVYRLRSAVTQLHRDCSNVMHALEVLQDENTELVVREARLATDNRQVARKFAKHLRQVRRKWHEARLQHDEITFHRLEAKMQADIMQLESTSGRGAFGCLSGPLPQYTSRSCQTGSWQFLRIDPDELNGCRHMPDDSLQVAGTKMWRTSDDAQGNTSPSCAETHHDRHSHAKAPLQLRQMAFPADAFAIEESAGGVSPAAQHGTQAPQRPASAAGRQQRSSEPKAHRPRSAAALHSPWDLGDAHGGSKVRPGQRLSGSSRDYYARLQAVKAGSNPSTAPFQPRRMDGLGIVMGASQVGLEHSLAAQAEQLHSMQAELQQLHHLAQAKGAFTRPEPVAPPSHPVSVICFSRC